MLSAFKEIIERGSYISALGQSYDARGQVESKIDEMEVETFSLSYLQYVL